MSDSGTSATSRGAVLQFIDGEWCGAMSGRTFEDLSPFSGAVYAEVPASGTDDARRAIAAASNAFGPWSATLPRERQRLFLKAADIIERRTGDLIALMALETGAARPFAGFQIQWAAGFLRQAANWAYSGTGTAIPVDAPNTTAVATRRPLGVVAGFSPWNGAFNLAWRTIAPPLACGNTVILKPSELAPISAGIVVAEVAEEAGFPAGVVNVLTHAPGEAGPIADEFFEAPAVQAFNFTGSTAVGRMLAERAGRHLKRIVLELGGFNPLLVLADADLDDAVETSTFAAFFHQGQICMNSRKLIIEAPVYEEFVARFVERSKLLRVGDPSDPVNQLGPLIHDQAVANAHGRIEQAVATGARVLTGGSSDGRLFEPTVLADVPPEATMYCEETFAPIVVVEQARDADHAVEIANASPYGLTAAILSRDTGKAARLAERIQAGVININGPTMYAEPIMPIGGVKESGWGRFGLWSTEAFADRVTVTTHVGPSHLRL